jgi:hypothetical protein
MALNGHSASLVSKLDDDINGPRAMLRRVSTATGIVLGVASRHIGGDMFRRANDGTGTGL